MTASLLAIGLAAALAAPTVAVEGPPRLVIIDTGNNDGPVSTFLYDGYDETGHGTRMAALAQQECPDCVVTVIDTSDDGLPRAYDVTTAIEYAALRLRADVIAVPLIGEWMSTYHRDRIAEVACTTPVVAAAGNNASSDPHYPAAVGPVVAVGSGRELSNTGPWVDVVVESTSTSAASVTHAAHMAAGVVDWSPCPGHFVR